MTAFSQTCLSPIRLVLERASIQEMFINTKNLHTWNTRVTFLEAFFGVSNYPVYRELVK